MSNIGVIYAQHKACRVVNKIDHLASPLTNQQVDDALNSGLILESCSLEDIEITLFNDIPVINNFMLEAISCKKNKVNVTISAFGRALDKELVGAGITADYRNAEVSKPRKVGLAAIMTAKVALSDGQSVSIVFHAPDDDPFVIKDQDTLIAFRFLLNSRDITHVVAPQGGSEISLIQVTKNIGNVVTANTEKFKSKQAENLALKAQVDGAVQQGEQLESEIALINEQEVKLKDAIAESNINIEKIQKRIDKQNVLQEKLQAEIDSIKTVIQEPVPAQEPEPEPTTSNSNTGTVIDLDTVPLSSVKTASVLNPTIKANATDGDDAIWYVQGKPSGIVDDSNRDFYTALNKAKTVGFHLVSYKHSRLQGIYVLQNDNDEVLTSKGFNKIKAGVKDAATPEPTPEPVAKYWYGMRIRPIGFGTQPDGHIAQMSAEQAEAKFPDFTERDYRYGAVGYAEQLTPDVIEHYNLTDFQKVVSVDGDIDTAEVTIEDAILAKLNSLKVNGFTQNEIDTYLQAFDSAKGTNKDKIQSLFSKELRQDFFFVNRKTDIEGYKTWLASLSLIDKAMLTKHLNKVLVAGSDQVDFDSMKGANTDKLDDYIDDNFSFGSKRFRDLIDNYSSNLEQKNQVEGIYSLYREYVNSGMKKGYSITKSAGEKLFASYLDLDDEVRSISNAGMLAKPSTTGIDFESMLKGDVSKEQVNKWLQLAKGLVNIDDPMEEPQQTSNTDGFKSTMADCLDNFKNGTASLADTKKRIKSLLKNSPQTGGMLDRVNELLAQRAKAKFISAFNDVIDYEPDAPVVDGIDFNEINFNMFDGSTFFGKSWGYVAKRDPERLIGYVESDDTHHLTTEQKSNVVARIKSQYMQQSEEQPVSPLIEFESEIQAAKSLGGDVFMEDGELMFMAPGRDHVEVAKSSDRDDVEKLIANVREWVADSGKDDPSNDIDDKVDGALADVKDIIDNGTNPDDCLVKLESAYNIVNDAGKFEQYEDLFTLAQDKLTELLTTAAK